MEHDRREWFAILGGGVVAAPSLAAAAGEYAPRALSAERYAALERMLEVLLPADEVSTSAREAGVGRYLDTTLVYAEERTRKAWSSGIDAVLKEGSDLTAALTRLAEHETEPRTEAERFFGTFKQAALGAYYLSEAGRKSLGYHGDTAVHHFAGCTHPDHKG